MIYTCCTQERRASVDAHPTLNGIDWLEVLDRDAPAGSPRQRTLLVRLLKPVPAGLDGENVRIEGGERVRNISVEWVAVASAPPAGLTNAAEQALFTSLDQADHVLLIRTASAGDFSTYRLRLVRGADDLHPPSQFDPRLVELPFSFKVECASDFDCRPARSCPATPEPPPEIDYLAKDYAGFRRLMLDRLSQLVPNWRERSAADLGVTLTELVAYAADHLSYWQDAVATEAYLETARRRTSLRRHALLVDYVIGDGCNSRAWLQVRVTAGPVNLDPGEVRFLTRVPGADPRILPNSQQEIDALRRAPAVFEAMHPATLRVDHNDLFFHTWGEKQCCLAAGATRATLRGHHPELAAGDVVIFEEAKGPRTGEPEDADPAHRHAVRLTQVQAFDGAVPLADPVTDPPLQITEIAWHDRDALPFPLCVSSRTDAAHGEALIEDVSVALGNIVLVDHGWTIDEESLGSVPAVRLHYPAERDAGHCDPDEPRPLPPRFRPRLVRAPLTHVGTVLGEGAEGTVRVPFDDEAAAADAFRWRMADVRPDVALISAKGTVSESWEPRGDLLDSSAADLHFVVEMEHDGSAQLRFGDDTHGVRPDTETRFAATYRVGNGIAGNVGTAAIAHVVSADGRIEGVRNPLPARGGVEPESAAQVRRRAPQAFRTQERAVTPADYAEVTERHDGVQRAAAQLRWTGSWHTVFDTVDRDAGEPLDPTYTASLSRHVDRFRMAGHDLRFRDPTYVSLELDLLVCVTSDHFRSDVRAGLLAKLGSGTLADGGHGVFHPDRFSFGQTVYLGPIYAAAREVPGVGSIQVTRFHRQGREDSSAREDGFMHLGPLEIARLDNDPNFPEHGVLRLNLFGGK